MAAADKVDCVIVNDDVSAAAHRLAELISVEACA